MTRYGFPAPAQLADVEPAELRAPGFSTAKARTITSVAGQVAAAPVCPAYGGPAVRGTVAYIPCEGGGMAAVDTSGRRIHVVWRGPPAAAGSPVLGGGAVWVAGWDTGTLFQLDAATGQVRRTIGLGSRLPHFASPSLSGCLVLIGTRAGVVAVSGA